MKNIALLAALLCIMACFFGCTPQYSQPSGQSTPPATTPEPTDSITTPAGTNPVAESTHPPVVELSQIPLSSISSPLVQESFYGEDGVLLLNYIYQNVFLIHQDAAVADSVYLALVNEIDYSDGLQTILQQAKEDYAASPVGWSSYRYEVLFDTTRIDQNVISIFGEVKSVTADVSSIHFASSYSLVNGKQLSFSSIQSKTYNYYKLLLLIEKQLKQSEIKDALFEDAHQIIADLIRSPNFSNWFFTDTGLNFFFTPYEIASNAAGTIVVEVPYSELTELIKEEYFPAESYITGGSVSAQLFDNAEIFGYESFAEIIQDATGEEFLLTTDGAVEDIILEYGTWNADGTVFEPVATVFACDGISASTAILVQCQLPDTMPVLRLTYLSNGTQFTRFITQSGKDGSILLTES